MEYSEIISTFIGVLVGGGVTYLFQTAMSRAQSKQKTTLELFAELHSEEMLKSRADAYALIVSLEPAERTIAELQNDAQFLVVSRVLHYLEKVGVFEKNGQLDRKLARRLLGFHIGWWHNEFYKDLAADLPKDSQWKPLMTEFNRVKEKLDPSKKWYQR